MILRGIDWSAVLGGSAIGALILAASVALTGDGPPLGYLRLGLVALAAAAAFLLDEPAAAAVDATPRTRRHRNGLRATVVVLPYAIWAGGIWALAQVVPGVLVGGLLVEGAGLLIVTLALCAILRMAGRGEPGEIVSAVVCTSVLAVLVFNPPPHRVSPFPLGGDWTASTLLWATLAIAGAMIFLAASRDPYLPSTLGHRHAPLPKRRGTAPPPRKARGSSPGTSRGSRARRSGAANRTLGSTPSTSEDVRARLI